MRKILNYRLKNHLQKLVAFFRLGYQYFPFRFAILALFPSSPLHRFATLAFPSSPLPYHSCHMTRSIHCNMPAMHTLLTIKELFINYIYAAMLEPILAIGSGAAGFDMLLNLMMLGGLFSWLALLTDAFDDADVRQSKTYAALDFEKLSFLKHASRGPRGADAGRLLQNAALWFQVGCLAMPQLGWCKHTDIIHAYAIVVLWIVTHHKSQQAVQVKGSSYLFSLLTPGNALMPLEFCLPLLNVDEAGIEDEETLREWHGFIEKEFKVKLTMEA